MSNRDSCTHHFEHVKQTRPFTEREYMQCAKCGLRNPLGLFQTVDFSQPGTPVYASLNEPISMRDQPGYFYRGHIRDDGTWCANCGKPLTILETLDPNERWTITNDGKGNLTIEHF